MARVTVEDCLEKIGNRFKLIMVASKRARHISTGTDPLVEWENDKPTVVALREIAESLVTEEYLQQDLMQKETEELLSEEIDEVDAVAAALRAEIGRELNQVESEPVEAEPSNNEEAGAQE